MKNNESKTTKDIAQRVTDKISAYLEEALKFERPWLCADAEHFLAHNPVTEHTYTGVNQFLLSITMFERKLSLNRWMTFKQVKKLGGNIEKGSKATEIVYTNVMFRDNKGNNHTPEQVKAMTTQQKNELQLRQIPYLRSFYVFNVQDTTDLPDKFYEAPETKLPKTEPERNEAAEQLINATGAAVRYLPQERAYYNYSSDSITMPLREQFTTPDGFYEIIFHELGHWTGHEKRCNREDMKKGKFGNEKYAFEELVAELCSAYVCASLGFTKQIKNSAAYIQSWLKALQNDKKFIFRASARAQEAADYLQQFTHADANEQQAAA